MLGRVQGHSVSLDQPITVLEMSLGGMSIETGFPLEVGSLHAFRLTLGDGATIEVTARVRVSGLVMHTRSTGDADRVAFVTPVPPSSTIAAPCAPKPHVGVSDAINASVSPTARPSTVTHA